MAPTPPRTRGDEPGNVSALRGIIGCSPHPRG